MFQSPKTHVNKVWQHLHTGVEHLVPKISLDALRTTQQRCTIYYLHMGLIFIS